MEKNSIIKRSVFLLALVVFIFSCGSGDKKNGKKSPGKEDITQNPAYREGVDLVVKNKCLTCHSITETVTGPPYRDIANKYADFPDTIVPHLAKKIISGGNGVWGNEIFMIAHPDLSEKDAETMVRYILLLGKQ